MDRRSSLTLLALLVCACGSEHVADAEVAEPDAGSAAETDAARSEPLDDAGGSALSDVFCPRGPKLIARPGLTWMDGCDVALCLDDGGVQRTPGVCPDVCELDGYTFSPGEMVPCLDGCNTCTCQRGGAWAMTDAACTTPPRPLEPCSERDQSASRTQSRILYMTDALIGMTISESSKCPAPSYRLCVQPVFDGDGRPGALTKVWAAPAEPAVGTCESGGTVLRTFDLRSLDALFHAQFGAGPGVIGLISPYAITFDTFYYDVAAQP